MTDKFKDAVYGLSSIPLNAAVVVPSDTVDLSDVCRRIHVGVGGDLKVDMKGIGTVTFKNIPTGGEKTGAFTRVYATGTTATDMVAEW